MSIAHRVRFIRPTLGLAALFVFSPFVSIGAFAQTPVSINFVGASTPMGSTETAGVVPEPNWNNANGSSSSSPLALLDNNGNATGTTITWSADDVWQEAIANTPANNHMMNGYLDNGNQDTTVVTVSNLLSSPSGYAVYVYAEGAGNGVDSNTGIYQISGVGITTTTISLTYNNTFNGTLTQGNNSSGNYVVFTIPNISGFTLNAIPSTATNGYKRAPLNGVQIVPLGSSNPDFTISASPAMETVAPGGSTPYTVTVSPLSGFDDTVNLGVSGLPTGATYSFNPASISASGTSTLTVTTASSTPFGTSIVTIVGTDASGSPTHSTTVTLNVTSLTSSASAISIDFVGLDTTPMASSEVAGAVPLSNWNDAAGATSPSPLALVDQNGNPTTATVSWIADDIWDSSSVEDEPGNSRMLRGYLDDETQDTSTVTVTGLPTNTYGYNVYVYAQDISTATKTALYQISGPGITTTSAILQYENTFDGNLHQSTSSNLQGNYLILTIPNVSGFTLSATPNTASIPYKRAVINALQIVPLGPPTPDFTISASPGTQTVAPGGKTPYMVTVATLNGFADSVDLSVGGLPMNATYSFNPASISGAGASTLTVTTSSNTPNGTSVLTITGTDANGSPVHSTTVNMTVSTPDFSLTATPATASVAPGNSAPYTVTVGALAGFSDTVNLTASGLPAGVTYSFNPPSIVTSGNSTLTITTTGSTPLGSSTITITGSTSTLTHTATVTLNVASSGSFGNPISIDFVGGDVAMAASETAGVVAASSWNDATGASNSSGMALADSTGTATGATITWSADDVWEETITDAPGNVRMMKGYLDNGSQDTTTVTVTGLPSNAGGYSVYVYAQGSGNGTATNTGIYQISGNGITTSSESLTYNSNFNGIFTQATNSAGNYVVFTIPNVSGFTVSAIPSTASNGYKRAPVNGMQIVPVGPSNPDFTISVSPSTAAVTPGNNATYTVTVGALNGFSDSVTLTASGLPNGATYSFNPTSISGSGPATLTINTTAGTPVGSSTLTITGTDTSSATVHTATATLMVQTNSSFTADAISINFVGGDVPMSSTEVAGVVAEDNWNNATGASNSVPVALVDAGDAATTAAVTWSADNVWEEPITDAAGNVRMMKGYLDNGYEDTTTIYVTGLPSDPNGYTVYVYADGAPGAGSNTGLYQISGPGITTAAISLTYNSNFNGTFTQANSSVGNYVVFTIPSVTGFTISAIPSTASSGYERAPVNGIQIVGN